jgi:hypothetical protein
MATFKGRNVRLMPVACMRVTRGGRQMRRHRTLGKTRNDGGEGGGEAASHDGESENENENDGRK